MLQFSNAVALHMQKISNTSYATVNMHCYEVAHKWCIVS